MAVGLKLEKRDKLTRSQMRELRDGGKVPVIIYGKDLEENVMAAIDEADIKGILRAHEQIVEFSGIDAVEKKQALLKEVQEDLMDNQIVHVDFNVFHAGEELTLEVPIILKGEPRGVKEEEGILTQEIHELEISCKPMNVPKELEVDVSELGINDSILIQDLQLPEGVRTDEDPEEPVASVRPPKEEEEAAEEEVLGEESAEPEVISERKETPEEGAEAGTETKEE